MGNILDKTIGFFSPKAGARRLISRANMQSMESQLRRYEGAADGRRHSAWLMKSNPSVNQLINKDLKKLVARSRELSINNGYARKVPFTISNSVVGTGIIPKPTIMPIIQNGIVKEVPAKEKYLTLIQAAWQEFANEVTCDYDGNFTFYGLQDLIMRTIIVSGEMLILRKKVPAVENKYGIQFLLLEADYIDTSKESEKDSDGGYTMGGIKFSATNKRTGYWIFNRHPSEGTAVSTLIPIADIIHVYHIERAGQSRGTPSASSTTTKQRDMDDYSDAELLGKKAQACMPIFVSNSDQDNTNLEADNIETIEPGAINYLKPGETVTMASPPSSGGFSEFSKTQNREIASGYLLTYEMFAGDYSNVNFSSGRMGWIEFSRMVDSWQYLMMIPNFCDKAFAWFIETLTVTQGLPKEVIVKAKWTAPRREMIDPAKETLAKKMAMRSGLMSWSETVKADGYDPIEVLAEMKADLQNMITAGITPDCTPFFELQLQKQQQQQNANNSAPAAKK